MSEVLGRKIVAPKKCAHCEETELHYSALCKDWYHELKDGGRHWQKA